MDTRDEGSTLTRTDGVGHSRIKGGDNKERSIETRFERMRSWIENTICSRSAVS